MAAAIPLASIVSFKLEIFEIKNDANDYTVSNTNDNDASLTMVVQPTNFEASPLDTPVNATEFYGIGGLAQDVGFKNMVEHEDVQGNRPVPEIELQLHENNALLAASGDSYPYSYQFNPVDGET